ncbi:MAG: cyclic nucleotide-binding domain-containing protein [Gammaproteobacteria bacterium]|nr:cyclic nucleotide-binding domain-containing protein [Gammaproteobacteria bacterium]
MAELVSKEILKTLVPPSALNAENFQELAKKAIVESLAVGQTLFKAGDTDGKTVYLLSGELELLSDSGVEKIIRAGTDVARHPLANQQPRQYTARCRTDITYTRFDTDLLDILLTWDQLSGIEVNEITEGTTVEEETLVTQEGGDWMTRILQSKSFMKIPPANIQRMFMRLREVPARKGDVVIKQGQDGDFYYIINRGRCKVTRQSRTGQEITLAELGDGDAFGEEALLSSAKRNATITMLTDGILMRLSKEDFDELLKAPMQQEVDFEPAKKMVQKGAKLLDVRLESEFKNSNIKGSMNLPIYMLRLKAESLDPSKTYICYCDTGRRSSAAAYLLSERGFDAYVLKGGLMALSKAKHPGA